MPPAFQTESEGETMQHTVLTRAVEKLASAGEQAGMSVDDMIRILQAGVSVETLIDLITRNRLIARDEIASTLGQKQFAN